MSVQNAFQNLAVNWGPLSDTMSVGMSVKPDDVSDK